MADTPESGSVAYQLFMLVVSVLALSLLAFEAMARPDAATEEILRYADTALCAIFFLDFAMTFVRSSRKLRYLATWGWLDLLSSIPLVSALRVGRLARVVRVVRVLRGIRSARQLATAILRHRAQSALLAAGLIALVFIVAGSIAILQFEDTSRSTIHGPEDAVWWSAAALTTAGIGDLYPVTAEGRVVAVVLNIAGVVLFGTLSGFFASWFLNPGSDRKRESELDAMRQEIQSLREAIEKKKE